jgi:hypothetical protein
MSKSQVQELTMSDKILSKFSQHLSVQCLNTYKPASKQDSIILGMYLETIGLDMTSNIVELKPLALYTATTPTGHSFDAKHISHKGLKHLNNTQNSVQQNFMAEHELDIRLHFFLTNNEDEAVLTALDTTENAKKSKGHTQSYPNTSLALIAVAVPLYLMVDDKFNQAVIDHHYK